GAAKRMNRHDLSSALRHLQHACRPGGVRGLSDGQLLDRWLAQRDEAAFEVLVWRHGGMVLNLCRRLIRKDQDAEDAFQATFLVLVRKAATIGKRESVASWLYKVAYRIAIATRSRRPTANLGATEPEQVAPSPEAEALWRDLRPVLDEEIHQLPDKYRRPFVL